jgi:hypothetical protein
MLLNDQAHSRMQLSGMSQCSTLFGDEFTDWLNTIALIPHKATKGRCEDVEAAFRGLEKVLGPVSKTAGHPRPPSNRCSTAGRATDEPPVDSDDPKQGSVRQLVGSERTQASYYH